MKNTDKNSKSPFPEPAERLSFPISEERFTKAREAVLSEQTASRGIGTLSEKSMHKILKLYIEPNEKNHEIEHLLSVADIKNEDGIFEIQTRAYSKLCPKLHKFLPDGRVTVVCPLSYEKSVRWMDLESGEIGKASRSPKHEGVYDAMFMLFGIREYINHPNLNVRMIFLESEEFRALDGWDKTGKRGSNRIERIPTKIIAELRISSPSQYAYFVPESLGERFTSAEFSSAIRRTSRFSFYVIKFLCACGAIEENGKIGRARAYSRTNLGKV